MESMYITKVRQLGANRYLLEFSNGKQLEVHEDLLVRYRLLKGKEIDQRLLEELNCEEEILRGYRIAINYISYRIRSVFEVRQHLRRKEISEEYIDVIIDRLIENQYLDDVVFAQRWVDDRLRNRPKGKYALFHELKEKGIPSVIIEETLANIDDETEVERAMQLGEKKLRQYKGYDWPKARSKMIRFLTSKGYGMDTIMQILPKLEEQFGDLA